MNLRTGLCAYIFRARRKKGWYREDLDENIGIHTCTKWAFSCWQDNEKHDNCLIKNVLTFLSDALFVGNSLEIILLSTGDLLLQRWGAWLQPSADQCRHYKGFSQCPGQPLWLEKKPLNIEGKKLLTNGRSRNPFLPLSLSWSVWPLILAQHEVNEKKIS